MENKEDITALLEFAIYRPGKPTVVIFAKDKKAPVQKFNEHGYNVTEQEVSIIVRQDQIKKEGD